MAIFHLSIKIISRGKGKSAVAAAAYRAGALIKSEYDGIVNDYTRKGGIATYGNIATAKCPSRIRRPRHFVECRRDWRTKQKRPACPRD